MVMCYLFFYRKLKIFLVKSLNFDVNYFITFVFIVNMKIIYQTLLIFYENCFSLIEGNILFMSMYI